MNILKNKCNIYYTDKFNYIDILNEDFKEGLNNNYLIFVKNFDLKREIITYLVLKEILNGNVNFDIKFYSFKELCDNFYRIEEFDLFNEFKYVVVDMISLLDNKNYVSIVNEFFYQRAVRGLYSIFFTCDKIEINLNVKVLNYLKSLKKEEKSEIF